MSNKKEKKVSDNVVPPAELNTEAVSEINAINESMSEEADKAIMDEPTKDEPVYEEDGYITKEDMAVAESIVELREMTPEARKIIGIAIMCHEANKVWCEMNGDNTQEQWLLAEQWQRDSAIKGVEFRMINYNGGPDAQHKAWMADKVKEGWVYGEKKDAELKTHPCLVPFDQLPEFQQKKDKLFVAIVDALK